MLYSILVSEYRTLPQVRNKLSKYYDFAVTYKAEYDI